MAAGPILPARKSIDASGAADATIPRVELVSSLPAFLLAVLLISASPGPAMALIFRRAALRGLAGAVPTVLGLELGLYCWALFAGAGFAALVAASEIAYLVLRVVGAAVLLVPRRPGLPGGLAGEEGPRARRAAEPPPVRRRWWGSFGEGVVVQLANPKAAVFMIAFYPQFVPADGPVFATTALLGLLQVTLETALYLGSRGRGGARGRHGSGDRGSAVGSRSSAARCWWPSGLRVGGSGQ